MNITILMAPIQRQKLQEIAKEGFGDMVEAVVDVEKGIMAVGGELHADAEALLAEAEGSRRENTWGINLYPEKTGEDWLEFDSMVNIKPALGNRSRSVESADIQKKIRKIVAALIIA